jgi:hypothetical protein
VPVGKPFHLIANYAGFIELADFPIFAFAFHVDPLPGCLQLQSYSIVPAGLMQS